MTFIVNILIYLLDSLIAALSRHVNLLKDMRRSPTAAGWDIKQ